MQGWIFLTHSYGELNSDRLHNNYNYVHLYHYSLLTSTHKPVLTRAPSSNNNNNKKTKKTKKRKNKNKKKKNKKKKNKKKNKEEEK